MADWLRLLCVTENDPLYVSRPFHDPPWKARSLMLRFYGLDVVAAELRLPPHHDACGIARSQHGKRTGRGGCAPLPGRLSR